MVYDEHYSINELIKEVSSLKTCNTTSSNATDRISLKTEATGLTSSKNRIQLKYEKIFDKLVLIIFGTRSIHHEFLHQQ